MSSPSIVRKIAFLAMTIFLSNCGTTYVMPEISSDVASRSNMLFAEANAAPQRQPSSARTGSARYQRVIRRVEPVARQFCEQEFSGQEQVDCNVRLEVDTTMTERNAYFTYAGPNNTTPVIRFTVAMLQDAKSDDEIAFIVGHEYGHLIGQHIIKQQQQQLAGALILGAVAAYGNAQAASAGTYYDPNAVNNSMELGATIGQIAFSKTYELESDMIGTRITAAAGYDPIEGAKYFARDEAVRSSSGNLSFWGTHPSDAQRVEVVLATMEQIQAEQTLSRN
jgi:Zn-dependent protease with chaperone function